MTENADVEWFRESLKVRERLPADRYFDMELSTARRLLAHIDQLEAEIRSWEAEVVMHHRESREDRRPTVHEIAPQMMAAVTPRGSFMPKEAIPECAAYAYDLAQALEAEGRRRDGR